MKVKFKRQTNSAAIYSVSSPAGRSSVSVTFDGRVCVHKGGSLGKRAARRAVESHMDQQINAATSYVKGKSIA